MQGDKGGPHGNKQKNHNNNPPESSLAVLNEAFNNFLNIQTDDQELMKRYYPALMEGGETFSKVFYDYLLSMPSTNKKIKNYESRGGKIDHLISKQLQHLSSFLSGHIDIPNAQHMEQIGSIHHQFGIEPVWIMGAYMLYLKHMQTVIRSNPKIEEGNRIALENSVTKLLFRDMGLMLEGYWDNSIVSLLKEKDKVTELQILITSLLANIPHLLWSVDVVNKEPLYVSPSAREICDMDIELPIPCLGWTIPEDRETVKIAWGSALKGRKVEVESRVQEPDGHIRWFRRIFCPFIDQTGKVIRIDGIMEDTTQLKSTLERLHTLATTDNLTNLPNRTLFHDRLSQAITAAERNGGRQVIVMLMDLNHFKEINDTLGHHAGDEVLAQTARRLLSALRESDTLSRLGGDEFAVLLPDVRDGRVTGEKVIKNIIQAFVAPFNYGDNELYLNASIGIAVFPDHGEDASTLMSHADVAMYATKTKEENYCYYDTALDPNAQSRLQLSGELRHAVARGELSLHYQPKIDLRNGRVMGTEALIRWQHPTQGLIPPDQFIPIAERTGLIRPITDWVIQTAVAQAKVWHDSGFDLHMAVNVSGRTLQDSAFVDRLTSILEKEDFQRNTLEIEVTENVLMSNITHVSSMLRKISALGVAIAIDDFGTGYSSLAYLKTMPLNTLKIDKSFVLDMANDENDAVIVRSTIDLAHNLGLNVVAEGIENRDTLDLLTMLGSDGAQGYYFSPPLTSDEFLEWLHHFPGAVKKN